MTDLEISKALALAIGWGKHQLIESVPNKMLFVFPTVHTRVSHSKVFDYRDWNVISPVAAKYNCFPCRHMTMWCSQGRSKTLADTPQKAIALAVIGAKK